MDLWTIQLSKHRIASSQGIQVHNITVKNGDIVYAPTWDMVRGIKEGTLSEAAYTEAYTDHMRRSWQQYRTDWEALLTSPAPIAIGCYCPADHFCHRFILADILQKIALKKQIPLVYHGELT